MSLKRLFAAAATVATSLVVAAHPAVAKTQLKLGTLAPKQSPWGKVFTSWSKVVAEKTANEVDVQWLWNGVAGPERGVVGKIRSGQLTGAAITATGLSSVYKPIIALQMPGAFRTWAELDRARDGLRGPFDKALSGEGFVVLGWGDVGTARAFSRGFALNVPGDLRGRAPAQGVDDIIGPKVNEVIGGIVAKPADVNELLPMLRAGTIDTITTPALAAEQLQWAPYLDHLNTGVVGFSIGALVISKRAIDALTPEQREIVTSSGAAAARALLTRIRAEDDGAYARVLKKMTVHTQTDAERAEWEKVWKKACLRVKQALPGNVLDSIGYC